MRAWLLLGLLGACYKVPVTVEPASATLVGRDGTTEAPPTTVRVPPRGARYEVTAPGYRSLPLAVPWRPWDALRRRRAREVEVRLVEEHGPAGTWGEPD